MPYMLVVDRCDVILNTYKAFACVVDKEVVDKEVVDKEEVVDMEEVVDKLWDYKKTVQRYLADLVYNDVMRELALGSRRDMAFGKRIENYKGAPHKAYPLTDREVMMSYDVLLCCKNTIIYGDKNRDAYELTRTSIKSEFLQCINYASDILGVFNTSLFIHDLPMILLCEEAIYTKRHEFFTCINESVHWAPSILMYIYVKHNLFGRPSDKCVLANDAYLLSLLMTISKPVILRLLLHAMSGLQYLCGGCAVKENIELFKTIVPKYIKPECIQGKNIVFTDSSWDDPIGYWDFRRSDAKEVREYLRMLMESN